MTVEKPFTKFFSDQQDFEKSHTTVEVRHIPQEKNVKFLRQ